MNHYVTDRNYVNKYSNDFYIYSFLYLAGISTANSMYPNINGSNVKFLNFAGILRGVYVSQ